MKDGLICGVLLGMVAEGKVTEVAAALNTHSAKDAVNREFAGVDVLRVASARANAVFLTMISRIASSRRWRSAMDL